MICAFAAVIGVFALVNAKEKPIEYSREELAELFEKYPVSLLCKEFDEKKVILILPDKSLERALVLQNMSYNSLYMSSMVIYMSGSTLYNDVEVMCSEQSAGSICMEGAVRTEAPASDAKAVS